MDTATPSGGSGLAWHTSCVPQATSWSRSQVQLGFKEMYKGWGCCWPAGLACGGEAGRTQKPLVRSRHEPKACYPPSQTPPY